MTTTMLPRWRQQPRLVRTGARRLENEKGKRSVARKRLARVRLSGARCCCVHDQVHALQHTHTPGRLWVLTTTERDAAALRAIAGTHLVVSGHGVAPPPLSSCQVPRERGKCPHKTRRKRKRNASGSDKNANGLPRKRARHSVRLTCSE